MINVNDNYGIQAPKPIDARYGPYDTIAEALAAIPLYQRYLGLTIGIDINNIEEYWWQDGLTDGDLVAKLPSINYPVTSVNGQTGAVVLTKTDIGLGNVANVDTTNASNISSGTLSDSRLSANVTTQGNTFNTANKLVQLDATAKLPAVDGSQLTNLNIPPPTGSNLYLYYNY